jgi:hypothetical protein
VSAKLNDLNSQLFVSALKAAYGKRGFDWAEEALKGLFKAVNAKSDHFTRSFKGVFEGWYLAGEGL